MGACDNSRRATPLILELSVTSKELFFSAHSKSHLH